jgi:HAE1 family hydrophobic/amphiphilic exporter-1
VAEDLRKKLNGIPGMIARVREGEGLFILRLGSSQNEEVGVEIRGYDLGLGQKLAQQIAERISEVKGVTDTKISREEGMPEFVLHIDRNKAADIGLSVSEIGTAVQTAMGGAKAATIRQAGKEYSILVRLAEEERKSIEQLSRLAIINNNGQPVQLQAVATITPASGPVRIERRDRERVITVETNFSGRDLGSVVNDIRARIQTITVPPEFAVIIRGDWEEQQKAFRELMVGLIMAILLVYLVMAGQFESFKDPFIVLFSIPTALIGVVLILYLTATPFSIQAFIGCIILAGIVVNNAIILIDYTNRLRREQNVELHRAIEAAGVRRLRPIMMTALTTVLGLFPLALALGEGGESQAPMARVVIGGLLASTMITLVLIPVIYSLVEERALRKRKNAVVPH